MDFDFSSEERKKESHGEYGFDDHSPNAGGTSPQGLGMSASDDFEHISGDRLLDTDYDLLGSSMIKAPSTELASSDKQNLLDGFSFTEPKRDDFGYDSSPKFGSPAHQLSSTVDFMRAERNEPPLLPSQPPTNIPKSSSLLDEIEDDYLNPYGAQKSEPPQLTSSWQKDDDGFGKRTPSPDPFEQTRDAIEKQQHSQQQQERKQQQQPIQPVEEPAKAPIVVVPAKILEPEKVIKPTPVKSVEESKKIEKPIEVVKSNVEQTKQKKAEVKPSASSSSTVGLTAAEEIFCKIGLGE